ncbi:hypothetical protein C8T65DRAFT_814300, partial [Cerioporus squamosus]
MLSRSDHEVESVRLSPPHRRTWHPQANRFASPYPPQALAALRHKPSERSIQAYILDLQAAFPSSPAADRHGVSSPNPWRDRVLALEKDLKELQAQCDKEKIELLALRKAARTNQSRALDAETNDDLEPPSDAPAARKKAKTKKTMK